MPVKEHSIWEFKRAIPTHNVPDNATGVVVHIHEAGVSFEMEIFDKAGVTVGVETFTLLELSNFAIERINPVFATSDAQFVQRGKAAIARTIADDDGIPAEDVIAKLESKVAAARKKRESATMHSPPHPGKVLAQYLGGMNVSDAAAKIGVGSEYLARLIDGQADIDAKLAAKLARAFDTSSELWIGMQSAHDNKLPLSFVQDIYSAREELADGQLKPYKFGDANE